MAEQKSSSVLTAPLHGAASVLRRVPGAELVGRAAQGTLDKVGAVSPRGRRLAVYTGAGVLGVAGVVEWPVALTGAAVAWLTQPRPRHAEHAAPDGGPETGGATVVGEPAARNVARATGTTATTDTTGPQAARKRAAATREPAEDVGTAALRSTGTRSRTSTAKPSASKTATTKAATSRSASSKASTRKAATAKAAATKSATTKSATRKAASAKASSSRASATKSSSRASAGTLGPTARRGRTTG